MSDEQDPEFNWLYDGKPGSNPPAEATRAMPVQPRSQATFQGSGQPPTQPPTQPSAPPGPGTEYRTRRTRRRPRLKTVWRVVLVLVVAWLAFLVWVPINAWRDVPKVAFEPSAARPAEQPGTTYLLVGSDSRAGLSARQRKRLHTGGDVGQRTDTIMLLHTGDGPNLLMSIPRDSIVEIPGHGTSKINAAFAWGGPELLVETIEKNTGIRVDQYAEIGLGGIVSLVNAVGGITICPTTDMKDPLAGLDIKKGCQQAGGRKALGYARSRHSDPRYGDITRAKHQREVVNAIGAEVTSPWSVINPFRYWKLAHAAPKSFAFGEGAGALQAVKWAWAMTRTTPPNGLTCGIPISDLAVHWDAKRSERMFRFIRTDTTDEIPAGLCTPTGLPKSVTG